MSELITMSRLIIGFRLIEVSRVSEEFLPKTTFRSIDFQQVIYKFEFDKGHIITEAPCVFFDYKDNKINEKELGGYCVESTNLYSEIGIDGLQLNFENGSRVIIQTWWYEYYDEEVCLGNNPSDSVYDLNNLLVETEDFFPIWLWLKKKSDEVICMNYSYLSLR